MSVFFPVQHLSEEKRREILLWGKEHCTRWWVDILDGSVSWHRQKIDMSFEDIMAKFSRKCHFVVIHRNRDPENFLEIAFSTGGNPDYFLWLEVPPSLIDECEELMRT